MQFQNADQYDWMDIGNEAWREYMFPGGDVVRVNAPQKLAVKRGPDGDSHRIICKDGSCHYIGYKWLAIRWVGYDAKPTYTF